MLSENPDRLLGIPLFGRGARIIRIHEQCHPGSWGELIEDLDALGPDLTGDRADPRHIAARTIVAGNETDLDRISSDGEHDRNSRRGSLRGARGSDVAGGPDHGDLEVGQFRRKRRESTVIALGPSILDPDILAFDETDVLKTLPKRRRVEVVEFGRSGIEKPDHRHCRLLSSRRLVQTDQRTSSHGEKLPSFHLSPRSLALWAGSYHIDGGGISLPASKRPENAGFRHISQLNGCRVDTPALPIER